MPLFPARWDWQKALAAYSLLLYHPPPLPPPPPEDPPLPDLEPRTSIDEEIALEKEIPSEVAKVEAVMGSQPGPEYQAGE